MTLAAEFSNRAEALCSDPRRVVAAILGYVLLFGALRFLWPALQLDDAVEMLHGQGWALAYSPIQPPLYTWMIVAAQIPFGPSVAAAALVDYVALALAYLAIFAAAREALDDVAAAALATGSLTLTVTLGYDAHIAITQSELLLCFVALAVLALLRIARGRGTSATWVLLGAALGLGLLSKYSLPLYIVPLVVAMLTDRSMRPHLLDRRWGLALAVMLVLAAPHLVGLAHAPWRVDAAWQQTMVMQPSSRWQQIPGGFRDFLVGLLLAPLPMSALWLLLLPRGFRWRPALPPERLVVRRLLGRWLLLMLAGALIAIPALGIGQVRTHYFLVPLVPAALFFFAGFAPGEPDRHRRARFAAVIAAGTAVIALFMVGHRAVGAMRCFNCWTERDYADAAAAIRDAGFAGGTILSETNADAGNLRIHFPDSTVYSSSFPHVAAARSQAGRPCLILWDGRAVAAGPPATLQTLARRVLAIEPQTLPPGRVATGRLRGWKGGSFGLAYVIVPPGTGRCG